MKVEVKEKIENDGIFMTLTFNRAICLKLSFLKINYALTTFLVFIWFSILKNIKKISDIYAEIEINLCSVNEYIYFMTDFSSYLNVDN